MRLLLLWLQSCILVSILPVIYTWTNAMAALDDYHHPSHYWPLGNSKKLLDIMEGKSPTAIHNLKYFQMIVDDDGGDGYVRFPADRASAILGSFTEECITHSRKCTSGYTIGFWAKIDGKISGSGNFDLLSITRTDSKELLLSFSYFADEIGQIFMEIKLNAAVNIKSSIPINVDKWYNFIVIVDSGTIFVNAKNIKKSTIKWKTKLNADYNTKNTQPVNLVLGQYPNLPTKSRVFTNVSVSVDNLAIWNTWLKADKITQIYSAEFGNVDISKCKTNADGNFVLKWKAPKDYYSQAVNYKMYWWPTDEVNNNSVSSLDLKKPNSMIDSVGGNGEVVIDAFEAKTAYTFSVVAYFRGNVSRRASTTCAIRTNNTKFSIYSETPTTILMKWQPITANKMHRYIVFANNMQVVDFVRPKLNFQIQKLLPSKYYNVTIKRISQTDNQTIVYKHRLKTMSRAEMFDSPVDSIQVKEIYWNRTIFVAQFHKSLLQHNMMYTIIFNKITNGKTNIHEHMTTYEVLGKISMEIKVGPLLENTAYSLDIKLSNGNSNKGPTLKEPIHWKTKVRFPNNLNISVIQSTPHSVSLRVDAPVNDDIESIKIFTRSNVNIKSNVKTFPVGGAANMTLTGLLPATIYTITAAAGNLEKFGNRSKPIVLKTNAYFGAPQLTIQTITSNGITVKVELLPQDQTAYMTTPSHLKLQVKLASAERGRISNINISLPLEMTIRDLIPMKLYEIEVELGDGKSFGSASKMNFTTKVQPYKDDKDCSLDVNACAKNMKCVNESSLFRCSCMAGYVLINESLGCKDLNECTLKTSMCGENEQCVNIVGSYQCQCLKGFSRILHEDGASCIDINECKRSSGLCDDENEECVNTIGSYRCECREGYKRKGSICIEKQREVKTACAYEKLNSVHWMITPTNKTVHQNCTNGYHGFASRTCLIDDNTKKGKWGKPDMTNCVNPVLNSLLSDSKNIIENPSKVANTLSDFVKKEQKMTTGDVNVIVDLMGGLIQANTSSNQHGKFTESMIGITSGLLQEETITIWKDLPQEKRAKNAGRLLNTADAVVEFSAQAMPENETSKEIKTQNMVMKLKRISPISDEETYIKLDTNVELPNDVLDSDGNDVTAALVTYKGMGDILGVPKNTTLRNKGKSTTLNSHVKAISVFPQKNAIFKKPVTVVHELQQAPENNTAPNCVYWESDEYGGYWSDKGCFVDNSNDSHVTCKCYHLTNFAILMTVTDAATKLSEKDVLALSMITMIGLSVSLGCLLLSFLTFISIRTIRSLRNTIHKHLVVALFIAEMLFLFGINRTDHKLGCQIIAASLHYFFLVAFFIMGLEGIVLYLMLVRVYRSMGTSGYGSPKFIILCWVLPIIVIVVNLFIDQNAYGNIDGSCWLSMHNGFIWSFVGPVALVIGMNMTILAMTLKVMKDKAKRRTSNVDEIWFWTKGCCLLLSILGVTWVFGIFYVNSDTVFMAYIFAVVNSLQGLSIFVFHCICDPRVRKAYRDFFCCVDMKRKYQLTRTTSRSRTTSSGSKASFNMKKKYKTNGKESTPLYSHGSSLRSSTPENSFGILVGHNKF